MLINVNGYRFHVTDVDRHSGNAAKALNEILFGATPVSRIHGK